MNADRQAASMLLQVSDLPRGARAAGVRSEKQVMEILKPHGCRKEATAEFHLPNADVRASVEIYKGAEAAEACMRWFTAEMSRTYAEDTAAPRVGDASRFFVTIVLSGRKRVASYALCWRVGSAIGKMTTIGPAGSLEKATCIDLAVAQAARMRRSTTA